MITWQSSRRDSDSKIGGIRTDPPTSTIEVSAPAVVSAPRTARSKAATVSSRAGRIIASNSPRVIRTDVGSPGRSFLDGGHLIHREPFLGGHAAAPDGGHRRHVGRVLGAGQVLRLVAQRGQHRGEHRLVEVDAAQVFDPLGRPGQREGPRPGGPQHGRVEGPAEVVDPHPRQRAFALRVGAGVPDGRRLRLGADD